MNILALDLSTKSTGYAIFIDGELKDFGCITASSTDVIKRIQKIICELDEVLKKYPFEKIVIEEVLPKDGEKTEKNHHTQKMLMWLQAAVAFLIHENFTKIEIQYLYPSEWRSACGIKTGRGIVRESLKSSDIAFVEQKFGFTPANDDIADAIGLGYGYLMQPQKQTVSTATKNRGMIKFGK